MKDIWTQPKLISTHGVEDFLYLWVQCATKTLNEAVVEGMGSVWAKAAPPERHVLLERSEKEAVIAWSAPQPWHPEAGARAGAFCTNALNHMFGFFTDGGSKGMKPKPWNFHHMDERVGRVAVGELSAVMKRHHKDPKRLPSWAYI